MHTRKDKKPKAFGQWAFFCEKYGFSISSGKLEDKFPCDGPAVSKMFVDGSVQMTHSPHTARIRGQDIVRLCDYCRAPGASKSCKSSRIKYCSKKCQSAGWEAGHKEVCNAVTSNF